MAMTSGINLFFSFFSHIQNHAQVHIHTHAHTHLSHYLPIYLFLYPHARENSKISKMVVFVKTVSNSVIFKSIYHHFIFRKLLLPEPVQKKHVICNLNPHLSTQGMELLLQLWGLVNNICNIPQLFIRVRQDKGQSSKHHLLSECTSFIIQLLSCEDNIM